MKKSKAATISIQSYTKKIMKIQKKIQILNAKEWFLIRLAHSHTECVFDKQTQTRVV